MKRIFLCANCGVPVAYGYRFCINCGCKLDWLSQQIPLNSSPLLNDYRPSDPQHMCHQQSIQKQQENEQKQSKHKFAPQSGNRLRNSTITPISTEIFKLLDGLFDKTNKYS